MTTLRQIKALVAPLLARHDDLVLVGNTVILKPLRHVLRGILIDRTGEAARCRPRTTCSELFVKTTRIPLGASEFLSHPTGLWWINDPSVGETLAEVAERDALPKLRAVETIRDYVPLVTIDHPRARAMYAATYALYAFALGELDRARAILAEQPRARDFWEPHLRRLGIDPTLAPGDALDAESRRRLAGLLHEWEAFTVEKLKLGAIHERTPFPLEIASAGRDASP